MQSRLLEQVQDPGTVQASEWKTAAVQLPVTEIHGENIIFSYTLRSRELVSASLVLGIESQEAATRKRNRVDNMTLKPAMHGSQMGLLYSSNT